MTTVEIGMMAAFVAAMGVSFWKLKQFMPTERLKDDDTTKEAKEELMVILYDVVSDGVVEEELLYLRMKEHPLFDSEHFWRFNQNRLRQLLNMHYLVYPQHRSIEDIYHHLQKVLPKD